MTHAGSESVAELHGGVHAWIFEPSSVSEAELISRCFDWLSAEEQSEREKLATHALKHTYLAAHALCRATLSHYAAVEPTRWRFDRAQHGKPFINEPADFGNLRFNLAHTHGLVVCAVSDGLEVGVDAEQIVPTMDISGIERRFFSAKDRDALGPLTGETRINRFFETWVLKEAYLKACGIGLLREPDTFTVPPCDEAGLTQFDGWELSLHRPSPAHVAAIAVRSGDRPIPTRWREATWPLGT
jgi:4'-phosphopantetheinyl transferase